MDKYKDLSRKQLKEIIKILELNLDNARNELVEKQNLLEKSLSNYELDGLKFFLNTQEKLSEDDWNSLHFLNMKAKDIDFFLYVKDLPEFKKYNRENNAFKDLTKTQEAIYASLKDKDLFDFFVNQSEFIEDFKFVLSDQGINANVDRLIINDLFEKELINLDDGQTLFEKFTNRSCFNFLEYLIETVPEFFEKHHYETLYKGFWLTMPDFFLDLMKRNFPEYKEISVCSLSDSFDVNKDDLAKDLKRMYSLIKFNESNFIRVLEEHKTTAFDIHCLMDAFQEFTPDTDKEFQKFIEVIAEKKPEHISTLKRFNCNTKFNKTFHKALDYLDIHSGLEKKDVPQEKKLKL